MDSPRRTLVRDRLREHLTTQLCVILRREVAAAIKYSCPNLHEGMIAYGLESPIRLAIALIPIGYQENHFSSRFV